MIQKIKKNMSTLRNIQDNRKYDYCNKFQTWTFKWHQIKERFT